MKKDLVMLKIRMAAINHNKIRETWDPDTLTLKEKRHLKEVLSDLKKGHKDKFISARELRKGLGFKD